MMNVSLVLELCQAGVRCSGPTVPLPLEVITRLKGGRELKVNHEHPYFFSARMGL